MNKHSPAATPRTASLPSGARLMSLDALRGFDMLWIVGAGSIVTALEKMNSNALTVFLAAQMKHTEWEGFRFYDLIFPLFLFIVGVSLVWSFDKSLALGGTSRVLGRATRRSLLLFACGVFYMGGLTKPWPDVALGGVLHRIAACYFLSVLLYVCLRDAKQIAIVSVLLLVGYWGLLTYVPIPDLKLDQATVEGIAAEIHNDSPRAIAATVPRRISGSYAEGLNLTNYVDFLFLPGQKRQIYYINEGLLSTLPATALTLFGILAGLLLKNSTLTPSRKFLWLFAAGTVCIALGLLWSIQFPLIKRIWTSSFVLLTGGLSAILLAIFYWIVDVKGWQVWSRPLVWVGCNALTIYLLYPIVKFSAVAERLVGGDVRNFLDTHIATGVGDLCIAIVGLLLAVLLMRFMFTKKIFIRL